MAVNIKKIPFTQIIYTCLLILITPHVSLGFDQEYKDWAQFLSTHLQYTGAQTRFDYSSLQQHPEALELILFDFSETSYKEFKTFSKKQQIAFLINGYNAFSLKLVADQYPVRSILNAAPHSPSPFTKQFIPLFGQHLSLRQLESHWLLDTYKDPRVLFAINCLCLSCPNLQKSPYLGQTLDQQLEQSISTFLATSNKNQIKFSHLHLSKLFDWHQDSFILAYGGLTPFFKRRWPAAADLITKMHYSYSLFNWQINEL